MKWIKRHALIGLWKFSPDLRKHNWASLGECNNDLRCEEQSERDPAPRSPQAPAGRRETVGENWVKMSSKHPDHILTTRQHPEKILTTSSNILQHLDKMPSTWVRQVVCEGGWLLGRATPAEGFSIGTILTKTRLLAKMLMNVTRLVRKQSFMWRALSKCHLKIATKTKWTARITGTCKSKEGYLTCQIVVKFYRWKEFPLEEVKHQEAEYSGKNLRIRKLEFLK